MVTAEEIGYVAVFSALGVDERERLARVAADISLVAGEYAAHEGDERAIFALLDGKIEAIKTVDGVERVVGERHPGDVFGEVPIALGTVFPVGFRAAERSRVMRLEAHDYHAVAAVVPDVGKEIGKLAGHRMGGARGLEGIAADPPPPRAIVVGQRWDPSCGELRRFLDRNQITFGWLTPETADATEHWGGPLPAEEDWPAIRVIGGKTVFRPQLRRVAELLGVDTEAKDAEYDTVIVGAGPAGFPSGVSGDELASRALQQARRLGAEILVTRSITRIDAGTRQLHLDGGDVLRARTIILACGVTWRQLPIEGFDRLAGKGISYGAARSEAPNTHGLDVHIVGAGNSAGQAALFFSTHARTVTILCRGDRLEKSMSQYLVDQLATRSNIDVMFGTEVAAVHGESSLEEIELRARASGETPRVGSGGLFIFIGADAETSWLPPEVALDDKGFVLTGSNVAATERWQADRDPYLLETSVPGIFACGDVRLGPVKRVAAAVGEGSMAIAFVHQYLKELDLVQAP